MNKLQVHTAIWLVLCFIHVVSAQDQPYADEVSPIDLLVQGASIKDVISHQWKCGLPLITAVRSNWDVLSMSQQEEFQRIFSRPERHTYVISPNGYFRIHYDTTGIHAPDLTDGGGNGVPDYIDSVAAIFDFVFEYHTQVLGYASPEEYGKPDPLSGEILRYDVYVQETFNLYGYTQPFGEPISDEFEVVPRYRTFIVIHKSFEGFPTPGLDGLRVTAAHELHHMIQLGAYGDWRGHSTDKPALFFYEITSTWLEDVVFPDINDYRNYLPVLSSRTLHRYPFYHSTGIHMYGRAIWGKMMERKYGKDIMRRTWEYIRSMHPLPAIDHALRDYGSTFEQELAEYHVWKFFTGTRARPHRFFEDGAEYPMLSPKTVMHHMGETMFRGEDELPQTLHLHSLIREDADTVNFLLSNVSKDVGKSDNNYSLWIYTGSLPNAVPIGQGLYYRISSEQISRWKITPVLSETPVADERITVFPNPFHSAQAASITFVLGSHDDAQLSIFSGDMRLVYQRTHTPDTDYADRYVIRWHGRDMNNRVVSSGVYIYVLQQGANLKRGKFTFIRE